MKFAKFMRRENIYSTTIGEAAVDYYRISFKNSAEFKYSQSCLAEFRKIIISKIA